MLLGSVPTPPKKPKSWTKIQSARHNATATHVAGHTTRRLAVQNAIPIAASMITTKRLTPHPWAASNRPNPLTADANGPGWGVWAMSRTMAVSVPVLVPRTEPCQEPRPGHACKTAMPIRNRPVPRRISRPNLGLDQVLSGRATRAPATQ